MLTKTDEARGREIAQALADADDARSALAIVVDEVVKAINDSHPALAGALRAADRGIGSALADLRGAIGEAQ